ncbi:MAG: GTP-dependent dephospho-CoA kinase family protein [Methanomicrobiales archaeon]|nr:GTP-dependent dephospho-CoA kinase family protein [Methanomicrobiales archaeon]
MRRLPESRRSDFQKPFGTLFPNVEALLPHLQGKIVYSVGDVVTHSLIRRGITPAVAIIDGHTMRSPCSRTPVMKGRQLRAHNPAGTISDDLVEKVADAVAAPPALLFVEGEEDLAVIPLVLAAPLGSIILYGQPREGVVLRVVDEPAKVLAASLLALFVHE